jgi:hypothetical protein
MARPAAGGLDEKENPLPFATLEEQIMLAHNDAYRVLAARRPYEDIVAAMDAFGARFIPVLAAEGDAHGVREVRRMVAAGHLDAAMVSELPLDRCEILLSRCFALGLDNLYDRALKLMSFVAQCEKSGDGERARLYLEPLIEDLETEHARTGGEVWVNCLDSARNQLARIEGLRGDG